MAVTINKKITLEEQKNGAQKEKDLLWISSLRQLIPPVGNDDIWKGMTPDACKLYLLIWALDSARWKWPPQQDKPYNGVHYAGLALNAGLKKKALDKAIYELIDLELIKDNGGLLGDDTYSMIYNLPADVIENGV